MLTAQPFQRQANIKNRLAAQLLRRGLCLAGHIRSQDVEHILPQTQPCVQRPLHLDVEPAFDRLRNELVGYQIKQRPWHAGNQREHQRQLEQQAAAKFATPQTQPHAP